MPQSSHVFKSCALNFIEFVSKLISLFFLDDFLYTTFGAATFCFIKFLEGAMIGVAFVMGALFLKHDNGFGGRRPFKKPKGFSTL